MHVDTEDIATSIRENTGPSLTKKARGDPLRTQGNSQKVQDADQMSRSSTWSPRLPQKARSAVLTSGRRIATVKGTSAGLIDSSLTSQPFTSFEAD